MTDRDSLPSTSQQTRRPRLGVALGSGAARGWAHVGFLRALDDLGVNVDVYAGCSVGALVSAARLLGIWDSFLDWGREISPLDAFGTFGLSVKRGGLVNPDKAFSRFADRDLPISELPAPWGAVATDLATGREVWLCEGSTLKACRASSSVPVVMHSAQYLIGGAEYWLIDGGATNPVPVNLARALGAERVIAVDLNAVTLALTRFDRPTTTAIVAVEDNRPPADGPLAEIVKAADNAWRDLSQRMALARAMAQAQPHLFETVAATIDIVQGQLAEARAALETADLRLTPDLSCGTAAAFDQHEAFEQIGYDTAMAHRDEIIALTAPVPETDIVSSGTSEW